MRDDYLLRRRLKAPQLGIAAGISAGLYVSLHLLVAWLFPPFGQSLVSALQTVFPFVEASLLGSMAGFAWVFVETYLVIWLTGTLYNGLTRSGYGCRDWRRMRKKK